MVVSPLNSKRKHMSCFPEGKCWGWQTLQRSMWDGDYLLLETIYSVVQNWNCSLPQIQFFSSVPHPVIDPTFSICDYSKVVEATLDTYFILLILSNLPFGLFDGHWLWILKPLSPLFYQCHKLPIHSLPGQPCCDSPQWASLLANSLPLSNLVYMYCFLCSLVKLIFTAYILVIVCQPDVGRVILEDWLRKCLSRLSCEQNHDVEGPACYRWSRPWAGGPEYYRKAGCAINGEQASKQHSPWPLPQFLPVFVRQWEEVLLVV